MQALIVLTLVAYAFASYPPARPDLQEHPSCRFTGDILRHPSSRCHYLECHPGDEPWYDGVGNLKLFVHVRQCPPGTAVSSQQTSAYGYDVIFRPISYNPTYAEPTSYGQQTGYGGNGVHGANANGALSGYGTSVVHQVQGYGTPQTGYGDSHSQQGYGAQPATGYGNHVGYGTPKTHVKYRNSYADRTPICSEHVDANACGTSYH